MSSFCPRPKSAYFLLQTHHMYSTVNNLTISSTNAHLISLLQQFYCFFYSRTHALVKIRCNKQSLWSHVMFTDIMFLVRLAWSYLTHNRIPAHVTFYIKASTCDIFTVIHDVDTSIEDNSFYLFTLITLFTNWKRRAIYAQITYNNLLTFSYMHCGVISVIRNFASSVSWKLIVPPFSNWNHQLLHSRPF